ncbi:unnamed protein product [Sphacelaria rigidula]
MDSLPRGEAKIESNTISEVLPRNGLVYSEKASLREVLCKPKLMPVKSLTLQKLEQLEQAVAAPAPASQAAHGQRDM